MYDMPEVSQAIDSLWQGIAHHLRREGVRDVPRQLVHDQPLGDLWSDRNLFFSQCCGYDVVHGFEDRLQVLGTPWFSAPGCSNGNYASFVVVPENSPYQDVIDMLGKSVVINGPESQSGMNALFSLVAPYSEEGKFFSDVLVSGSHVESLAALARGDADVAAVDCLTYELLRLYRPATIDGTKPIGSTYPAPAPPYVTRLNVGNETVTRMTNALLAAFEDPGLADTRQILLLGGFEVASVEAYHCILSGFSHQLRAV